MFTSAIHQLFLYIAYKLAAVNRKKLHGLFRRLVGTEKAVAVIVTASIHTLCQDLIQGDNLFDP